MKKTLDKPFWHSVTVDPSPHLKDTDEAKDIYLQVIKAGDRIKCWLIHCKQDWVEGYVEEIDGILWVRVCAHRYKKKPDEIFPENEQPRYKLINNFINRCYYVAKIDNDGNIIKPLNN